MLSEVSTVESTKKEKNISYVEFLKKHNSYQSLRRIDEVRGVDFARQAVFMFSDYLKNIVKNEEIENAVKKFLFSNDKDGFLYQEYLKETSPENFVIEEKKQEVIKKPKTEEEIKLEKEEEELKKRKREIMTSTIFKNAKRNKVSLTKEEKEVLIEEKKISEKLREINKYKQKSKLKNTEVLKEKTKQLEEKDGLYKNLCSRLSCSKERDVRNSVLKKNEELSNRFLFLLENYPRLIEEKSNKIKMNMQSVGDTDLTIEILDKNNVHEALAFGITTPCCLNIPASGAKYLYSILFDPKVSMGVLKDEAGHAIATCLITDNEDKIGIWHVDASRYFKPKKNEYGNKSKEELIKNSIDTLMNTLAENTGLDVFIAPGEATLTNMGYLDNNNIKEINIKMEEFLFSFYRKKDENLNKSEEDIKNSFSTKIESSVGSGRTDVGDFKYFVYALENFDKLDKEGQEELCSFISNVTGWGYIEEEIKPKNNQEEDIFEIGKDEGHGLCAIQFSCKRNKQPIANLNLTTKQNTTTMNC